ncbi:MAG: hypothetical protein ABSH20_02225 [Tepidisphaeraceae bacterium]
MAQFNYLRLDASDRTHVRVIASGMRKQESNPYSRAFQDIFDVCPPEGSNYMSVALYTTFQVVAGVIRSAAWMRFVVPAGNDKNDMREVAFMIMTKEDDLDRKQVLARLQGYMDIQKLPSSPLAVVVRVENISSELDEAFGNAAAGYFTSP